MTVRQIKPKPEYVQSSLEAELAATRQEIKRVADGIENMGSGLRDIVHFWKKWGPIIAGTSLAIFPNLAPIIGFVDRVLTNLPVG